MVMERENWITLTIDTSDKVYVGDWNHRISVFTTDGQFLTSFMRPEYPSGLAVDASGVVCVCDSEKNHIQLF